MSRNAFCKCENKDCEKKDTCARFLSEHRVPINYIAISNDKLKCTWYIEYKNIEEAVDE